MTVPSLGPNALFAAILSLGLWPGAAAADYPQAVNDHILPGLAAFRDAAEGLAQAAQASCAPQDLAADFHATFDAWLAVAYLRLGATETQGLAQAVQFWPDPKGLGLKAQRALLAGDVAGLDAGAMADQSVAARGLSGLERLLWPKDAWQADTCPLIRLTAQDLAATATRIEAAWLGAEGEAARMLAPGSEGNTAWHTGAEVRQALYTQILASLEFLKDTRIGRPLGSFDRPRPDLAESQGSARPVRNMRLTLESLAALTRALTPDAPQTRAAFDRAIHLAAVIEADDPQLQGITDPSGRLQLEILQQAVAAIQSTAATELAREMDVSMGFNAGDGD